MVVQIHATVVSIDGSAVVLRGPSGSGKSDLALRLIGDGAILIADDRCNLSLINDTVYASAPSEIAGLLEVRGLGVYRLNYLASAPVALVIDLAASDAVERLPKPAVCTDLGAAVPCIRLAPFEASAPDKVRIAVRHAVGEQEQIS